MLSDYHVHSEFSDDSEELMEVQIEKAIALGLREICFTDHVDYGIKRDYDDPRGIENKCLLLDNGEEYRYTLNNVDYPHYFEKLKQLRSKYEGQIIIKSGLEFGIQTITIEAYENIFAKYQDELDFVLLSIHQVNNQEFWTGEYQTNKSQQEYNEEYYRELLKVIQNFKHYSCLAHLDLIRRYDEAGSYPFSKLKPIITKILQQVIVDGKGIEINTSSWKYGLSDTMPSHAVLELYYELGGRIITIGSDAHSKEQVGDHFEDAKQILQDIGFTGYYVFNNFQAAYIEF